MQVVEETAHNPPGFAFCAADLRHELQPFLGRHLSPALVLKLELSIHEIVTNLKRHSEAVASALLVDFVTRGERIYCRIRDNGEPFHNFPFFWQRALAAQKESPLWQQEHLGLKLLHLLWPETLYHARAMGEPWNAFLLPLPAGETIAEHGEAYFWYPLAPLSSLQGGHA